MVWFFFFFLLKNLERVSARSARALFGYALKIVGVASGTNNEGKLFPGVTKKSEHVLGTLSLCSNTKCVKCSMPKKQTKKTKDVLLQEKAGIMNSARNLLYELLLGTAKTLSTS